jgi:phage terminase small subunit
VRDDSDNHDDDIGRDNEPIDVETERDPTALALPTDPRNNAWEDALEAPREVGRAPWGLTHRQWLFLCEYFVDLNATKAAVRAGYKSKDAGYRLMRHPVVKNAIEWQLEREAKRYGTEPGRIFQALAAIAFSDPGEFVRWGGDLGEETALVDSTTIPANKRQAVKKIRSIRTISGKDGENERVATEIEFESKLKALELIGKATGLFREKDAEDNRGAFRKWFDSVMSGETPPATREVEMIEDAPKGGGVSTIDEEEDADA